VDIKEAGVTAVEGGTRTAVGPEEGEVRKVTFG
jgi:hypothetical protein